MSRSATAIAAFLVALAIAPAVFAQDDPRTLRDLQVENAYLMLVGERLAIPVNLETCQDGDHPVSALGIPGADVLSSTSCLPTPTKDGEKHDFHHYRILGLYGKPLVCNSVAVILTNAEATSISTECGIPNTFRLRIPIDVPLSYARLEFGQKLIASGKCLDCTTLKPTAKTSPCTCSELPCSAQGCSAEIDVRPEGNGLRVTGHVNCGVKCDINAVLTPANPKAELECTAGDVRTMVRLTLDGRCVKVEGKACVRIFGSWRCSDWIELGEFCP